MSAARTAQAEVFAGAAAETDETEPAADVEIDASASAAELRPLERPRSASHVTGGDDVRAEDETRRRNLPDRLEPGAVYRDVLVRRRIAGRLPRPDTTD